jgi:hypothetical protein
MAVKKWRPKAAANASGNWRRRDEPPWHDPKLILVLARDFGFSNYSVIANTFSLGLPVFAHLPVFRNFFAHRGRGTSEAARNIAFHYSISGALRPSEILLSNAIWRPQPLILDWIDDISAVIDLLCEV